MFAIVLCLVLLMCTCVVCINCRRYGCCSECYVTTPALCDLLVRTVVKLCTFTGELDFLNCDDICMCVENEQYKLFEFVFDSVYVNLKYDEISLTFTAGSLCGVCGHS